MSLLLETREPAPSLLGGLGVLGIVNIGALAYDSFPQAAVATTAITGAIPFTDGAAATPIAGGGITVPYIVTHLTPVWVTNTSGTIMWTIRPAGSGSLRYLTDRTRYSTSTYMDAWPVLPYQMDASAALELLIRGEPISASKKAYVEVCKVNPVAIPSLLRVDPRTASAIFPTTATATAVNSAAGTGTYGAYVQITASVGTPNVLIYSVTISSNAAVDVQVAFSTGAAAAEVDWGVFGIPRTAGTAVMGITYNLPFPVLVPGGTRIAARVRNNTSAAVAQSECGFAYCTIPLV